MASPIPVLPLVASTTVCPGLSCPVRSASSMTPRANRSLTDPIGLKASNLTYRATCAGASFFILTTGVRPIVSRMLSNRFLARASLVGPAAGTSSAALFTVMSCTPRNASRMGCCHPMEPFAPATLLRAAREDCKIHRSVTACSAVAAGRLTIPIATGCRARLWASDWLANAPFDSPGRGASGLTRKRPEYVSNRAPATTGAQDRENTRLSPAMAPAIEGLHAGVHDDAHGMSRVAARRQTRCGVFQCRRRPSSNVPGRVRRWRRPGSRRAWACGAAPRSTSPAAGHALCDTRLAFEAPRSDPQVAYSGPGPARARPLGPSNPQGPLSRRSLSGICRVLERHAAHRLRPARLESRPSWSPHGRGVPGAVPQRVQRAAAGGSSDLRDRGAAPRPWLCGTGVEHPAFAVRGAE